jgi:hypothetical protein
MMGQLAAAQHSLFYDFCLEKNMPSSHLPRRINEFLDFEAIRTHLKPFYSDMGTCRKKTRAVREYLELLDQEAEFNRPKKRCR